MLATDSNFLRDRVRHTHLRTPPMPISMSPLLQAINQILIKEIEESTDMHLEIFCLQLKNEDLKSFFTIFDNRLLLKKHQSLSEGSFYITTIRHTGKLNVSYAENSLLPFPS